MCEDIIHLLLQRLPVTRAPQRFFSISKSKFWWMSIKCFHDNSRVHFASVSQPRAIVVGSGIIALLLFEIGKKIVGGRVTDNLSNQL